MPAGVIPAVRSTVNLAGPVTVPEAKVRPPQLRSMDVPRTDALDRVLLSDPRILVVCAPAGFGKTTFVGQWVQRAERPVAWAALDPTDADPVVLISTLLASLTASGVTVPDLAGVLTADEPAFSRRVLTAFRRVVESLNQPVTVVVDDLHLVQETRLRAILTGFVDSLPTDSRIALVSRTEPDLPLARWQAAGLVEMIGQSELAFDASDVGALFEAVAGHKPDPAETESCLQRTSGWPVAAYLEATFGPREGSRPVTAGTLGAYLDGEVLAGTPRDLADFLRDTAVLTLLSGVACDVVLDAQGSHDQLLRAARSTLLVSPVRDVQGVYRLHPLIRDHLLTQLAVRDPARAGELHARAAAWCADAGYADDAIRHAIASGRAELIGRLIWAVAEPALAYGRVTRVKAWLEQVDDRLALSSSELCITATWAAAAEGAPASMVRWGTATAELLGPDWSEHLGRSTVEPSVALLLALQGTGGFEMAAMTARAAASALPIESTTRPLARLIEGWSMALAGDVVGGSVAMTESLRLAEALDLGTTWVEAAALLAFVEATTGQWAAAEAHVGIARRVWVAHDLDGYATSTSILTAVSAWVQAKEGRLADAREDVERAQVRLDDVVPTLPWFGPMHHALMAQTELLLDRPDAAQRAVDRASTGLVGLPHSPLLVDFIAATRQELELRKPLAHLTPSERKVWDLLTQGFSRQEMAQALFVSEDTIKTHVSAIYRKLGVSNRREAMRLAADLSAGAY